MLASEAELRARAQIIAAKCWRLNPKSRQNGARKNDEESPGRRKETSLSSDSDRVRRLRTDQVGSLLPTPGFTRSARKLKARTLVRSGAGKIRGQGNAQRTRRSGGYSSGLSKNRRRYDCSYRMEGRNRYRRAFSKYTARYWRAPLFEEAHSTKNEADFLRKHAPGLFKVALPSPVNFAVSSGGRVGAKWPMPHLARFLPMLLRFWQRRFQMRACPHSTRCAVSLGRSRLEGKV